MTVEQGVLQLHCQHVNIVMMLFYYGWLGVINISSGRLLIQNHSESRILRKDVF